MLYALFRESGERKREGGKWKGREKDRQKSRGVERCGRLERRKLVWKQTVIQPDTGLRKYI